MMTQRRVVSAAWKCRRGWEQMGKGVSCTAQLYVPREPFMRLVKSNWGVRRERTEPDRRLRGMFRIKTGNVP